MAEELENEDLMATVDAMDDLDDEFDVEIVDDTPQEDQGRDPLPQELVQELDNDELDDYSDKVKVRLKQMKKVWHDERRAKEREEREKNEAFAAAQRLLEENRRLKASISQGENSLLNSVKQNVDFELTQARREYRDAYESGDADKVVEAQEKMNRATIRAEQISNYRPAPALQDEDEELQQYQQPQAPRLDSKTIAWQERNQGWWGRDPEMTASALGLHQKLELERGSQFVGSDEYYSAIDKTMRKRFPEYFGGDKTTDNAGRPVRQAKPATVVAPASRSRTSKKVQLTASQAAVAKKFRITPEQYAREVLKLEPR
jgi:hypothetical protein